MQKTDDRKAEEDRQRFKARLKKIFPTIGTVYSVHDGPNRAARRQAKFKKVGSPGGRPTNTQKPAFF